MPSVSEARLEGRAAIVTGAAQGIGARYAAALAAAGAAVACCDVLDAEPVAARIRDAGGRAIALRVDVTSQESARAMAAATLEAFGRIDVLVNNAGLFANLAMKPFDQIDAAEWDRVMAVNVRGSFECAKAVVPQMRAQGYGKIVNIGSGTVFKGAPMLLHYVTSKGAVTAMTRALARELGDAGIRVNTLWLGLRHTRLQRASERNDPSDPRATDYAQSFTTPFVAASHAWAPGQLVYASWGRGVESDVAPNRTRYANAGETFTQTSRQIEFGLRGSADAAEWNAALFDIRRPRLGDFGSCDIDGSCVRRPDGEQRHRGLEAGATLSLDAWTLRAGAQWLRARVQGSSDPAVDGKQPTNVPARTLKLQADHRLAALPGLTLQGAFVAESHRQVLPDKSAQIPGWARIDLGARLDTRWAGSAVTWRAGVDNVADRRAWRESPYQFGHAYLFPLEPRTFRVSVQADL